MDHPTGTNRPRRFSGPTFVRCMVRRKGQGRSAADKHTANTQKYGPGAIAYGNDTGPRVRYEHAYGTGVSSLSALRHTHRSNGYGESAVKPRSGRLALRPNNHRAQHQPHNRKKRNERRYIREDRGERPGHTGHQCEK